MAAVPECQSYGGRSAFQRQPQLSQPTTEATRPAAHFAFFCPARCLLKALPVITTLLFTLLHLLVFLAGVAAMEVMTWAMHRWVMHGPLWCWHRSHHQPGRSSRAWHNDLFALAYVVLAMALFWLGLDVQWRALWWLALGVIAYGLLYVLVHEGLLHQRIPFPLKARRGYLLRLVDAHLHHHRARERDGAAAFGFLWAPGREQPQAPRRGRHSRAPDFGVPEGRAKSSSWTARR